MKWEEFIKAESEA